MRVNPAKEKMRRGEPVSMAFVSVNDTVLAETVVLSGIDIIVVDNEHMAFDDRDLLNIARAITSRGGCALLRTAVKDVQTLTRYMALGFDGFCATQTSTFEEAEAIVAATKFPPMGERGLCNFSKGYNCGFLEGMSVGEYMEFANENTMIFVTLENQTGLDNAEAIARLEGIDSVHVGPNDLSASLGYRGDTNHPEVVRLVKDAQKRIVAAGNTTGAFVPSAEKISELVAAGEKILIVGTDLNILRGAFSRFGQAMWDAKAAMTEEKER